MTSWDRFKASQAYIPRDTIFLSEVIEAIESDWTLPAVQSAELVSTLGELSKNLNRNASELPANVIWLEAQLRSGQYGAYPIDYREELFRKIKVAFKLSAKTLSETSLRLSWSLKSSTATDSREMVGPVVIRPVTSVC